MVRVNAFEDQPIAGFPPQTSLPQTWVCARSSYNWNCSVPAPDIWRGLVGPPPASPMLKHTLAERCVPVVFLQL